ncbi:MAG: aldehyde dehydrogenase family protein, partial [Actinobacteria bacterium]
MVALAAVQDGGHVLDDDQQLLQGADRQGRDAVPVQQPGLPADDQGAGSNLGDDAEALPVNYQLYIGGQWVDATSDDGLDVINPATEETIGSVPRGSIADVDRAVGAARKAFEDGTWRRMPPRKRSDALLRFMQTIADRRAELVDLIIAEAGAARWVAEGLQFDTGFKYAQWFAERTASFPFQDPLPPQV